MENLRYPIGRWSRPESITASQIQSWIDDLQALPETLKNLIDGITADQWNAQYREGSWTVLQLVHHLADSHINAYERQKKAATARVTPIIVPYEEERWALLADVKPEYVQDSLNILFGLHHRWVAFLRGLEQQTFHTRGFYHVGEGRIILLEEAVGLYSWHSRHHLAHIGIALGRG